MSTTLEFQGTINIPALHGVGAAAGCSTHGMVHQMTLELFPTIAEFDETACVGRTIDSVATWLPLFSGGQFEEVGFFALTIEEGGQPIELLFGAPPELTGVAVFPSGLTGGETFSFDLVDLSTFGGTITHTVLTTFLIGDQTAVQCAERINAAAALLGLEPVAAVVNGQIVLSGDEPGGDQALEITTPLAAIGFSSAGLQLGTGTPMSVSSNIVLTPELPGDQLWIRGGLASVDIVVAGS